LLIKHSDENARSAVLRDPGERLRELDGWRAMSVLLVVFYHIAWFQHRPFVMRFPGLGHVIYYCGPLGVKVFFVISGFVICRLLILEDLRYGSVSLKSFYYRRVFRILPPLFTYLGALSLLLGAGLIHEHWKAISYGAFFLYDLSAAPPGWFVGHTWSLAVEEQFYLIFPALWIFAPRRWRSQVFFGVFLLCALWNLPGLHTGWDAFILSDARQGFACISCGVLLAIHERRVRAMSAKVPAFIVALVGLLLLMHPAGTHGWQAGLYEGLLVPPAIGLVLSFSLVRGHALRTFLCSKPVQAVGLTSYGIYLWQQLFTAPGIYLVGAGEMIPLLLPALALIVPMSYFLIEKPAIRFGKFLSRRARSSHESVPTIAGERMTQPETV
jgi:peptidoglycan/LPS O-acetylase OafA/YrhL